MVGAPARLGCELGQMALDLGVGGFSVANHVEEVDLLGGDDDPAAVVAVVVGPWGTGVIRRLINAKHSFHLVKA